MLTLTAAAFTVGGRYGSRLTLAPHIAASLDETTLRHRRILLRVSSYACYLAAATLLLLTAVTLTAIRVLGQTHPGGFRTWPTPEPPASPTRPPATAIDSQPGPPPGASSTPLRPANTPNPPTQVRAAQPAQVLTDKDRSSRHETSPVDAIRKPLEAHLESTRAVGRVGHADWPGRPQSSSESPAPSQSPRASCS